MIIEYKGKRPNISAKAFIAPTAVIIGDVEIGPEANIWYGVVLRGDVNYAWPTAEVAVMGPEGAVNIVYRRELEKAADKEAERARLVEQFREKFDNPYIAAERGYIDAVIMPRDTRPKLIAALRMLANKRDSNLPKKHGNIPQ